jgi:hypothetical protein
MVGRWERNGWKMGKERLADEKGTVGRWERNGWQMGNEQLEDEGKRKNYCWKQGEERVMMRYGLKLERSFGEEYTVKIGLRFSRPQPGCH